MDLVVVWVVEYDFQFGGSALIWSLSSGRRWLALSVRIEITWVFVSGHRNRLDSRVGIKIDLISMMELKFTWFLCAGSKLTCFSVGIDLDFFFVQGSKSTWVLCAGRKLLGFNLWSKLTWFLCSGWKWLVFSVGIDWRSFCAGDRNCLRFCMLGENRLISVWASNLTSSFCGWSKLTRFNCGGSNFTWYQCTDRNWLGFGMGFENDLVLVVRLKLSWF